jgi:formate-dependent nitrite reductase membrane component NrfD
MSKNHAERLVMTKIDLIILGVELFFITHMFMGFLASTEVQIEAAALFLGGPYTAIFWIFVVILGIVIPAVLDIMELRGYHVPAIIPGSLVLLGSLMLRFIFAFAGQESRWLY